MKRIYSSKLYKASKRKDKIDAAIQNPVNNELMMQLSSYLENEDAVEENTADISTNVEDSTKGEETIDNPEVSKSLNDSDSSDSDSTSKKEEDEKVEEDVQENDDDVESATNTSNVPAAPAIGLDDDKVIMKDITETDVKQDDVVQASAGPISCHELTSKLANTVDEIAGLLNSRASTSGVSRIMLKEDNTEMWIHYNDNINLNNTMTDVIMLLSASNYDYLVFNRLARSENAIVFQVSFTDIAIGKPSQEV